MFNSNRRNIATKKKLVEKFFKGNAKIMGMGTHAIHADPKLEDLQKLAKVQPNCIIFHPLLPDMFTLTRFIELVETYDRKYSLQKFEGSSFLELKEYYDRLMIERVIGEIPVVRGYTGTHQALNNVLNLAIDSYRQEAFSFLAESKALDIMQGKLSLPAKPTFPKNGLLLVDSIQIGNVGGSRLFEAAFLIKVLQTQELTSLGRCFHVFDLSVVPASVFSAFDVVTVETDDIDSTLKIIKTVFESPSQDYLDGMHSVNLMAKAYRAALRRALKAVEALAV